jgi:hypothetical protein
VGRLPDEVQKITIFSAGIVTGSKDPVAAKSLIPFLASPAATQAITATGLEAISAPNSRQKILTKATRAPRPLGPLCPLPPFRRMASRHHTTLGYLLLCHSRSAPSGLPFPS